MGHRASSSAAKGLRLSHDLEKGKRKSLVCYNSSHLWVPSSPLEHLFFLLFFFLTNGFSCFNWINGDRQRIEGSTDQQIERNRRGKSVSLGASVGKLIKFNCLAWQRTGGCDAGRLRVSKYLWKGFSNPKWVDLFSASFSSTSSASSSSSWASCEKVGKLQAQQQLSKCYVQWKMDVARGRQAQRQRDVQTDRQADRQAYRGTDRQTETDRPTIGGRTPAKSCRCNFLSRPATFPSEILLPFVYRIYLRYFAYYDIIIIIIIGMCARCLCVCACVSA